MIKNQEDITSPLVTLNKYTARDSGVFACRDAEAAGLSYSDGDAEEEYIYRAVASAGDLSSLSEEFRSFERDWASECHLSSKRANVFRALDFTGVQHVLEIGSGCGAITRFLGEQGMTVDAVEGSMRRAEITWLRCRELENVTVIQADFNGLQLPEGHYDLALLTGVLEYAGKFSKKGEDPVDAAVAMLDRIISCLSPGGTLVIAIENRIGFKYLAGAGEDHFSRSWVGLSNYPVCDDPEYREKRGIRTWDKSQWQGILERLPGVTGKWYYPFPDYKLATSLLSEDFIRSSPSAWSCLSRVSSRDYTSMWHPQIDEQLFWQTAAAARAIEEMANSFVLVLQRERSASAPKLELVSFDFVHFSGHNRKPEYRVKVQKKKGENRVTRSHLTQEPEPDSGTVVIQHLEEEPYYEGKLLAVYWADVLRSCPSQVSFDVLLQEYYQYIVRECEHNSAGRLLDLLPFNIVVSEDGSWHAFDQEWQINDNISPQFIAFRAMLYFYMENKEVLKPLCTQQHLNNGWDFVEYCLGRLLYSGEIDLKGFVELENTIQKAVNRADAFTPIEHTLDSSPERTPETWSWGRVSLVWGEDAVSTSPVSSGGTSRGQCISFDLPAEACFSSYIQLSLGIPENLIDSVFAVHSFILYGRLQDGSREKFFPTDDFGQVMPSLMKLTGLTFFPDEQGGVFVVEEKEPQILHFLFPEQGNRIGFAALDCEIVLELLGTTGTQIRLEQYRREKQALDVLLEKKQHQLSLIEQSRAWQTVLKLRKMKEKIIIFFGRKAGTETSVPHGVISSTSVGPDAGSGYGDSRTGETQTVRISVILGVYNTGADELRRSVDSVLAQSYRNWELIIVDSGSTDGVTLQALAEIKHPKIKIHYLKKSENLTRAMDEGISLASGSWISFLSHFDRYQPDAFSSIVQEINGQDQDVVYCDEEIVGRYGDLLEVKMKPEFSLDALDGSDVIGASLFIRRSVVLQAGGLDPEFDGVRLFDLVLRASRYTDKIIHLDKPVYQTRQFEPPTQDELDRNFSCSKSAWERSLSSQ